MYQGVSNTGDLKQGQCKESFASSIASFAELESKACNLTQVDICVYVHTDR